MAPCAVIVCRHAPLWAWRRCHPRTMRHTLIAAVISALLDCLGGGGVSVPYSPPSVPPRHYLTLGGQSGVLSPQGNFSTPGVSMPCGDLTPPRTPWQPPLGFSATL